MNGDKLVRRTGYLAVLSVSGVAALLSYWHAVTVVGSHGEPGVYGHLYPATVDGLVVAASMVLLDSARNREKPPRLAWWLVAAGIFGTLAANVLDGISYGFLGAIIAAWPAAAFVGAYEMIMILVRSSGRRAARAEADITPLKVSDLKSAVEIHEQNMLDPAYRREYEKVPDERVHAGRDPWFTDPSFAEAFERPGETRAVSDSELSAMTAGHVQVQSPLSRLDRKVPMQFRETGAFPVSED